jgi:molybdopterin-containing oxidoreductase family membrane subunit
MAEPVFVGNPSDVALTDQLLDPVWGPKSRLWRIVFVVSGLGTLMLLGLIFYTFYVGIGVWGVNIPVGWAFAITNFVWWIGIGHAGTFISAILLLFEQK